MHFSSKISPSHAKTHSSHAMILPSTLIFSPRRWLETALGIRVFSGVSGAWSLTVAYLMYLKVLVQNYVAAGRG